MLIGVLADSHDRLPMIEAAVELFNRRGVQAVMHAGDVIAPFAARRLLGYRGPIYVTYGNNDGEREGLRQVLPQIKDGPLHVTMSGRRILMHHYVDWCSPADVAAADIVITGHTHEVTAQRTNGTLFLNPGECCGWVYGRPTAALLETDDLSVEVVDL